jgi:hypothetical protein
VQGAIEEPGKRRGCQCPKSDLGGCVHFLSPRSGVFDCAGDARRDSARSNLSTISQESSFRLLLLRFWR